MEAIFNHACDGNWAYSDSDIEVAIDNYLGNGGVVPDTGVITIYSGIKILPSASKFVTNILGAMEESASLSEELPSGWPELTERQEQGFQSHMLGAISNWFKENQLDPTWFGVTGVIPVDVKLTGYDPKRESYCSTLVVGG